MVHLYIQELQYESLRALIKIGLNSIISRTHAVSQLKLNTSQLYFPNSAHVISKVKLLFESIKLLYYELSLVLYSSGPSALTS